MRAGERANGEARKDAVQATDWSREHQNPIESEVSAK